ncbi:MAG TPA: cytochrome c oxidase subunit 3 [Pararhizobium sp.]|uniref:cytochrome c oxidase subunit 3 n=1 Tax=Pararhizobium sp. TaxID=1977563 RepID=UPI002BEE5B0B|nr:cytochrome c oxidase subunit 3 [Pararhizobium sp.]HTO32352.1 cytochrome c oxidase subunit 3 [Pararhizobium sp.]
MTLVVDGAAEKQSDGDLILWILVWSELIAFGVLLSAFLVMSLLQPESYAIAKLHLNGRLASINTVVLIVSGWLAAEADRAASIRIRRLALVGAACLGFAFVAIKLVEYSGEIRFAGDAAFSSFFELYFIITGFHLAHVIFLGLVMLLVAHRAERSNVMLVATLWHVIDIVWLVIFPVIYLG